MSIGRGREFSDRFSLKRVVSIGADPGFPDWFWLEWILLVGVVLASAVPVLSGGPSSTIVCSIDFARVPSLLAPDVRFSFPRAVKVDGGLARRGMFGFGSFSIGSARRAGLCSIDFARVPSLLAPDVRFSFPRAVKVDGGLARRGMFGFGSFSIGSARRAG